MWMIDACSPMGAPYTPPVASFTPTLTATPTATIVWFPPTPTFTPPPHSLSSPTAEFKLELGKVLLKDDFSTEEDWLLGQFPGGSIALGKNELTIHVSQPKTYLYSVRNQLDISDFYLEVTANVTLCQGDDEYGVLYRVLSMDDYYRFAISCSGNLKVERVIKGKVSVLQPWLESIVIPPGAPNIVRIGIWALGKEMRFSADGISLFAISDSTLSNGSLGLFARSSGQAALTVNFSDLTIWEIK